MNPEELKKKLQSVVGIINHFGDEYTKARGDFAKELLDEFFPEPKPNPKRGEMWKHESGVVVTYLEEESGVVLETPHKHQKVGQILDDLSILCYPEEWRPVGR